MARRPRLRPARFDELGLRRAISDRLLPLLVGAMAFLGALALAGLVAAAQVSAHWRGGAGSILTVQVPAGGGGAVERVAALLRGTPGIRSVRTVPDAELRQLLQPWLGRGEVSAALPAVLDVRLSDPDLPTGDLAARLAATAPGTVVDAHEPWLDRLTALARSLQACAALATLIVAGVAAAVVAVATRAGLMARRDSIGIVHGLGATDGFIAGRFAGRAALLATTGAAAGTALALPVLLGLASLAAPFASDAAGGAGLGGSGNGGGLLGVLPPALWVALPGIPLAAALIGWGTAQGTVRRWLRRMP